jgi:hypothetical protein
MNEIQDAGVSYIIVANGESFKLERLDNEKDLRVMIYSR